MVHRQPLADDSDHGAVTRRHLRHIVGGGDAPAARHVDDHHRRIAGDVFPDEARQQAGVLVIVAAHRGAHDEADLLALVEVRDRIGRGRTAPKTRRETRCGC